MLHATSLRIPVVEVEGGTLTAVAGFDGHQGIALVVDARRWASTDEILALAAERAEPPLVLVLDSLEDPQNLGTLLRSAEASGVHGAVFPTRRQAPLSAAAVKASAGAVEHLRLAPVDDLPGALADLHVRGLRIVGADGDAALTARDADLRGPIAIVVGSEGKGLGSAVRRRCDLLVRIPMHGRIESLNAAVAGSILLYEAAAQRRLPERSPRPPDDRPREAEEPDMQPTEDELPRNATPAAEAGADGEPAAIGGEGGTAQATEGPSLEPAPAGEHAPERKRRAAKAAAAPPTGTAVADDAGVTHGEATDADDGGVTHGDATDADDAGATHAGATAPAAAGAGLETPTNATPDVVEPEPEPEPAEQKPKRRAPRARTPKEVAPIASAADDSLLPGEPRKGPAAEQPDTVRDTPPDPPEV